MLVLYAATVILVTLQKERHHGNFLLFRCTFDRLLAGKDLYLSTPDCRGYLYSPAFAFLFGPFALLPTIIGLFLWNALNAGMVVIATRQLFDSRKARLVLLFVYLDVVRSLQNSQSNALIAGLLVLTFVAAERGRPFTAALATGTGTLTKIFPAAGGIFALLQPRPFRGALIFLTTGVGLALLPAVVTPLGVLIHQYQWWLGETTATAGLRGQSLLGIAATWFHYDGPNWPIQVAGALALLAPLVVKTERRDTSFRLLFLSSLLVFVVLFNHQAESPSYVIATTGIGIWVVTQGGRWRQTLALLTLVIVSAAATSLVPFTVRHDLFRAYSLQALPCVLCWIGIQIDLWRYRSPK